MAVQACLDTEGTQYISTGTLAQMNALTGAAGQMFFNTTYNSYFYWSVNRWMPIKPDPRYGYMQDEDWLGATVAASFPYGNNTTGSGNAINATPTALGYGELILECTAASTTANIRTSLTDVLLGGADHYFEAIVRVPTLATALEDFSIGFGWNDNAAYEANTLCVDGIWATLDRSINGAKIVMNSSANSVRTATNATNATILAATTFRIGIYVNGTTSATFYVNGVSQGTVSSNLPTGAGRYTGFQIKLDKTAGSLASQVVIDHVMQYGYFTTARAG